MGWDTKEGEVPQRPGEDGKDVHGTWARCRAPMWCSFVCSFACSSIYAPAFIEPIQCRALCSAQEIQQ